MKTSSTTTLSVVLLILLFLGSSTLTVRASVPLAQQVPALRQSLLRGEISKIEIFYYPTEGETRVSLTPSRLEKVYTKRLVIRLPSRSSKIIELPKILDGTTVSPLVSLQASNGAKDFRTGCIFYNVNKVRQFSLYVNEVGKIAMMNGTLVILHGKLYQWLQTLPNLTFVKAHSQSKQNKA